MRNVAVTKLAAVAVAVALAAALVACVSGPAAQAPGPFEARTVAVMSRGVAVPAVLTAPVSGAKVPLVVMAHGHGGSKEENGGFTSIAEALAAEGIASIRMDFPGCGVSVEPFTQNNLTNMLADIEASRLYAIANAPIDARRVGMFGYSMGGRLAILSTGNASYKALGLLAPVATDGPDAMFSFMGGADAYAAMAAKAAAEGHVVFTTPFGQVQDLGAKWFEDNGAAKCIAAIRAYSGPVIYVRGAEDTIIVEPVVNESAAAAAKSSGVELVTIKGADHGYGFYGGDPQVKLDTVSAVSGFFAKTLR
ncbi:MAG: alpha/beta hydrolase [Spirochaetes bacterium]|nr:alpha/beta hydrolase [Spirochaetota bacterium]MBU1079553.1 alpha/beta hydrolase [Spirochaetota bacterium]